MVPRSLPLILGLAAVASALQTTPTRTTTVGTSSAATPASDSPLSSLDAPQTGTMSSANSVVKPGLLQVAAAGMVENVSAAVQVSGEPGHPMHDCCCSCPWGTDRYCSPVGGTCYTERVDELKPYYQLCYGPEAPRACPT